MPTPRERLTDARLYLCAPADTPRVTLDAALAGGVDLLQLRDHGLDGDDDALLRAAEPFQAAAADAGALFLLNDRPDLAARLGTDGVHVGQEDLTPADARAIVGSGAIIGLSSHAPDQGAAAAADPDVDYVSIGPVHATPTKPGRPAAGVEYVAWAAANVTKPWFAIGGLDAQTAPEAVAAGASRIVVVRAILEAEDPRAVAAGLRGLLPAATARRRPATRTGLAADLRRPAAAPKRPPRPDADARHGPDAGMSRSEARNMAIREGLEPLAPDERPLPLKIAIGVALLVAAANLVLLAGGYELPGAQGDSSTFGTIAIAAIMVLAAGGMWQKRYWAVLGFQTLLGITAASAGLSLLVASNALAAVLCVVVVGLTGWLFYKLVRIMARIQTPPRPAKS